MAMDYKEAVFMAHQVFRELMTQEMSLATGLQSLAPTNKTKSSNSAQYLYDDAIMLKELSEQLKELLSTGSSADTQKTSSA